MPEPRLLKNAPITEAVIDLRVKPRTGIELHELELVANLLAPDYAEREEIRMREFLVQFAPDAEKVESRRQAPMGFRLTTPSKNRVVQVRPNGLTYSWLKPYSNWADFRTAAKQTWDIYVGQVRPNRIVRAAVRYINHIPLPLPIKELRDFLPASPDIPREWPQMMTGYLSRIGVADEASGNQAIVTQTSELGAEPGTMSFLLDIDCFNGNPSQVSDETWELIDDLRDLKDRIFFSSVTEQLLEMFE